MALPSNYKQIAVGAPTGPATSTSTGGSSGGSSRSRSSGGGGGSKDKDTTPIFTHSNYGNPAFTPQKAGKSAGTKNQSSDSRTPKPPKPPEKPILPYMRYSKRIWDSVKSTYPDLKLWELGKKIGAMWKQLGEAEKQEYLDEYEADKVEYEKALKAYHNSPAYLTYMAAKSKVKTDADVHETPSRSGGKGQQERRIDIQPAEDEDDQDEGYSFKHIAYARYLRNHRLINEIFSDAVVPDVRSVVTTQRMQVLKRQVSSLTMHQTKLEAELQQMEEKFEAKKQRMVESSEAFQEELKRHCKPAVDEDTFQRMAQKMYEEMRRDRLRMEIDPPECRPNMSAVAAHATGPRAEEKPSTVAPSSTATAHEVVMKSSAGSTPTPTKKEAAPLAPVKPTYESSSKTDPEPMDIEPTPKPSVPLPPKSETRPVEPIAPHKAHHAEQAKEPVKASSVNESISKPPTPAPPPTPTPPPPALAAEQSPGSSTGVSSGVNAMPTQAPTPSPTPPPPPPQSQPQPQPQQMPTSMPMHPHVAPPTHPHIPAHMPPHQPMSALPPHASYGNYGAPSGPTRSPYYQPQYGAHPSQPYGQYAPYSHYQQPYGPPPGAHYMNPRPPPQHNGSSVHYPDHGAPVGQGQQPPTPGHMPPHDVYGQQHNAVPPQQQPVPASVPTPTGAPPVGGPAAGPVGEAGVKNEAEKKDSE